MESLKEWATVVRALEDGKQTVLLRKGGILETVSGFSLESRKFLLFPTYEHQTYGHIKPQFHRYLDEVKKNTPREGFNRISSYAEVIEDKDIEVEKIDSLSDFHIWSDSYIKERRNWMPEKPMKAVFLKVFKIPDLEIPLKSEFQGCKSWVDINANVTTGTPVLNDSDLSAKLEKFRRIVN